MNKLIIIFGVSGSGKSCIGKKLSNDLNIKFIDTLLFAKKLFPNFFKFSLTTLCDKLGIQKEEAHRATGDTLPPENVIGGNSNNYNSDRNNKGFKANLNCPMAFENLEGFLHVQVLCLLQYSCLIQMLTWSKSRLKKSVEKGPKQNKTSGCPPGYLSCFCTAPPSQRLAGLPEGVQLLKLNYDHRKSR